MKKGTKVNKEYAFNWNEGGYNTVYASSIKDAIAKGNTDGYPTYMPDNEYARERSLRDVLETYGQGAVDYIINYVATNGEWSNAKQSRSYPKLTLDSVGFSKGLTVNVDTVRAINNEQSNELNRIGNMMSM